MSSKKCCFAFFIFVIICSTFFLSTNYEKNKYEPIEEHAGIVCSTIEGQKELIFLEVEDYENEKQEDAFVESGYYRDDVPLSYEDQDYLQSACEEFDISYALALAIIERETGFENSIGNNGESFGYMQIQEKWHKERMEQIGAKNLMFSYDNFRTGLHFMNELLSNHDLANSLTYYNSGKFGTNKYAKDVISKMGKWESVLASR